jgi:hypothetical protein
MNTNNERQSRIERLKEQIREATGEDPTFGTMDGCPPELEEAFLQNVLRFETAAENTLLSALQEAGVGLPNPDELDDAQINPKLWEVVTALAELRVYIHNTDHLSDRELYTYLWRQTLVERVKVMPDNPNYSYNVDATENNNDEYNGMLAYLKYYANDHERSMYAAHFPDVQIPQHCDPPYDRDRLMPCG